jgi:hypothetical protein
MTADKPTRFAADLLDAAAVEGARQSRSAKQQLDYWTRIGRAVDMHDSAVRQRMTAVLDGRASMATLGAGERRVLNAELDAAIQQRAQSVSFGERAARDGITTVALDDDGNLVEYGPDGTATPLE